MPPTTLNSEEPRTSAPSVCDHRTQKLRAHSYSTWIKHFSRACTRVDLSRSFLEQTEHAHENDYSQLGNRQYARDPRSH